MPGPLCIRVIGHRAKKLELAIQSYDWDSTFESHHDTGRVNLRTLNTDTMIIILSCPNVHLNPAYYEEDKVVIIDSAKYNPTNLGQVEELLLSLINAHHGTQEVAVKQTRNEHRTKVVKRLRQLTQLQTELATELEFLTDFLEYHEYGC